MLTLSVYRVVIMASQTTCLSTLFKIFKGFDNLDPLKLFELSNVLTRNHSLKLKSKMLFRYKKIHFAHRAVYMWNS
jgi:hypothetical protein